MPQKRPVTVRLEEAKEKLETIQLEYDIMILKERKRKSKEERSSK